MPASVPCRPGEKADGERVSAAQDFPPAAGFPHVRRPARRLLVACVLSVGRACCGLSGPAAGGDVAFAVTMGSRPVLRS